ncbi:MAG: GIY-YIG nuclease family protein, partial [bacterium]|nr:GIY-YIG nuclease family protein [bacterium]
MYYVYIIQSRRDSSYYKGFTEDIKKQLSRHNGKLQKYTSSKAPFRLVWYCAFMEKKDALRFEKYIKSGSGFAFSKKHLIPKQVAGTNAYS